jgi:molybdenum cofactor biosynthesis protein MoaC
MVDITHKHHTLRTAIAQAEVWVSSPATIEAIRSKTVPKGDVLEAARVAGLFAAKRTSDIIPDCHPLPVEFTQVSYELQELSVLIKVEIRTIYKTGVEVEAMHAASVVALTMYDMLKPIDKGISIERIRLEEKSGGKSGEKLSIPAGITAAVVLCSEAVCRGAKADTAGRYVCEYLTEWGLEIVHYQLNIGDVQAIQEALEQYVSEGIELVVLTGGTGTSAADVTPEAVLPLLDRRLHIVEEAIGFYGLQRTPKALLSRCVAGTIAGTLVLVLPGSVRGVAEALAAIFPQVLRWTDSAREQC